jgi:ubiquinol-cytochrome c reductase cytochrome b/c1 subunit
MTRTQTIVVAAIIGALVVPGFSAFASDNDANPPPRLKWSFAGPFGKFDQGQLQRGFKIFKEVCAGCHSMDRVGIGALVDPAGLGFSAEQVKALAAQYSVRDLDENGEPIGRPARPADHFPPPFPNELAARAANGGVAPPDMSTLAKARGHSSGLPWSLFEVFSQYQEQGPDYIAALLTGYVEPPASFKSRPGSYYNEFFPGHAIAMPPPLSDGQVNFDDDAPRTLNQYSRDISAFLMWAAEPHLVARKRIGFQAMAFLLLLSGLLFVSKKKVWASHAQLSGRSQSAEPSDRYHRGGQSHPYPVDRRRNLE